MDDEGILSFSAELEEKGFVEGMNKLLEAVHGMAEEVKKTGMTVDQFSTKALASFDTMTAAIERQTQAQGKAGKAGHAAAEAERKGADKATEAIDRTGRATDELGRKLQKAGDEGSVSFGKMAKYAAGFFTLQKAKEFGQKMFDVRKEMESLQVSFETLAGADVGKQLYEDIKQFTLNTPMMMGDLAKGAQTLLGFNIEAQKVMPILKQIGDISMGDSQKFNSLTLAFAQMSSTGKLMGQDLLQMINAGFNPLVVISEKTGKSVAELKDEMSNGAISVEMVEEAFRSATEEGGKFHGMLDQQSKTLGGAYSNLLGAIDEMFNEIGEKSEGIMAGAIDTATLLARNYEMVGKVIIGLVATYGTYKAAVMTVTAVERIQALSRLAHIKQMTLLQLATDILTKKTALLNATMLANPYVLAATAIGALVSAMVIGIKHTDVLADGQKKLNETYAEAEGAAAKEQRKIDDLFGTLRKAKNGTEEWKNAKSAILSQYGGYLKRLGTEVSSLKDVESAYRAVSRAARDAAMARGMEAAIGNINNDYGDTYSKNFDKIRNSLKSRYGEDFASKQMNLLRIHMQRNGGLISDNNKEALKGIMRGTSDYGNMDSWVTALNNAEKNRQQLLKEAQEKFGKLNAQIFDAAENPEGTGKHNVRNKRAIEEDKKKAQAELDSLEAIDAAGKKGAALRKKIAGYDKELESYSASSDKKAATKAAKQWKETVKSNAATIQEERRYQEELDKYTLQAEQARSDARIAAIRNDAERERAEQDEQHRRSLQQIAEQADEMRKAIYEHNKKAWETEHKDSPYELTEEGKNGWQAIKSLYDLRKERQEIVDDANRETAKHTGISIFDPKSLADGKKDLEGIISQLERLKDSTVSNKITTHEITEHSLRLHGLTDDDIRKLNDGTVAIGDVEDALQALKDNGEVKLALDGLENANDMESVLETILSYMTDISKGKAVVDIEQVGEMELPQDAIFTVTAKYDGTELDKLDEIPSTAEITINTKLGDVEVPDIPQSATIEVVTEVNADEYERLVREFGEDAVKRVDVEVSGDAVPDVDAEVMEVTIRTDSSQLDALKAAIPSESEILVHTTVGEVELPEIPTDCTIEVMYDVDYSKLLESLDLMPKDTTVTYDVEVKGTESIDGIISKLESIGVSDAFIDAFRNGDISAQQLDDTIKRLTESQEKLNAAQKAYDNAPIKLTKEQDAILEAEEEMKNAEHARMLEERRKADRQQLYDYIKEYGSIQEKRLAITKEYDEKIAETNDATQKAFLEQQKQQALSSIDFESIQKSIDWETVFNDLELQSTDALRSLREKLKSALDVGDIEPENAKVLAEKILEIEDRISERTNVWSSLIPALKERERITRQVAQAEDEVTRATNRSAEAVKKMHAAQVDAQNVIKERTGKDISIDDFRTKSADEIIDGLGLSKLETAGSENAKVIDEITQAIRTAIIAVTDATKAEEELTQARGKSQNLKDILGGFKGKGIGGAISDIFKNATGNFDMMGIVNVANQNVKSMSELVDTLNLANTDFGVAVKGFAEGTGHFTDAISSLASGDIFGTVNNVIQGFDSFIGMFRGSSNHKEQLAIQEELSAKIESSTKAIERLTKQLNESYGSDAIKAYEELVNTIGDNLKATVLKIDSVLSDNYGLGHSDYYHLNKQKDILGQITAYGRQYNVTAGTWQELLSNDAESLAKTFKDIMEQDKELWYNISNELGYNEGALGKTIEELVEQYDQLSEADKKLKEQLTTTSFDNVWDSFMESIYSLADGSEEVFDDVAENWRQMVNKMVLNNLVGQKYKDQLKEWYDDVFSQTYAEGITEEQYKELIEQAREQYNDILRQGAEDVERLKEIGIVTPSGTAAEDKNASNVMAEKATYDQFEKYLGIATAQQMAQEQIKSILQRWDGKESPTVIVPESQSPVVNVETKADNKEALLIIENLRSIADITSSNGSTTREIRELVKTSNEYLMDIKKSNREILDAMTTRLDNMNNLIEKKL